MAAQLNYVLIFILITLQLSIVMGKFTNYSYTQKLDHFGPNNHLTFQQMVLVDDSQWAGADVGAPIFVLFGGEDGLTLAPDQFGILNLSAFEFQAMIVNIQHRFYGNSVPLESIDLAMADEQVRSGLTTDQALQDFRDIILSLKNNFSAYNSPVIVMGKGYAGGLATWFRETSPEIAIGALASSTPLMYYGNITSPDGYCSAVSKYFQDFDSQCYHWIYESRTIIKDMALLPNGLAQLSHIFNTCRPLHSSDEVNFLLAQLYSYTAQNDDANSLGINSICRTIDSMSGTLESFVAALRTELVCPVGCFNISAATINGVHSPFERESNATVAWAWQRCNELIFPVGCANATMLPAKPFDMTEFKESCQKRFGVVPRPYTPISFFKARNMEHSLVGFGGNIIFSNGLRDPFASGGILKDLSETIVAITTDEGVYGEDLKAIDDDNDPEWLREQRKQELKIFRHWISHFHHIKEKKSNSNAKYKGSNSTRCTFFLYCLVFLIYLLMYTS